MVRVRKGCRRRRSLSRRKSVGVSSGERGRSRGEFTVERDQ